MFSASLLFPAINHAMAAAVHLVQVRPAAVLDGIYLHSGTNWDVYYSTGRNHWGLELAVLLPHTITKESRMKLSAHL